MNFDIISLVTCIIVYVHVISHVDNMYNAISVEGYKRTFSKIQRLKTGTFSLED